MRCASSIQQWACPLTDRADHLDASSGPESQAHARSMEGAHNSRGAAASIGGLPEEVLLRVFAGLPTPARFDVCSVAPESIGPMLDSPDPSPPRTRHHAPYQNAPIIGRRALWWLRGTRYDLQASPTARVPSMGVASGACELGVGRVAFDVAYGYDFQREAAAPVQRSLPCD